MRVKMVMEVSGLRNGEPWPPKGGTLDLPDDEAATLCANRMAVPAYDPESRIELAVSPMTAVEARQALVEIAADEKPAAAPPTPATVKPPSVKAAAKKTTAKKT